MLVEIITTKQLRAMQKKTGKSIRTLVNEIIETHLDNTKRNDFILNELDRLFELYTKKHTIKGK